MAGAPSQLELFDYKPDLMKLDGQDCPQSLVEGKRFAFHSWYSKNVRTTGNVCTVWTKRCMGKRTHATSCIYC